MKKIIFIVLAFLLFSCTKKSDTKISSVQWNIVKVEGGVSETVNQPLALTVYWPYTSGSCDFLDKFEETKQANIILIKAYGHISGGLCTDDAGIKTKIFNFISPTPGTFELRFINKDNSFISHFVTIN